jgi:23S rRNA (cytidine1920-2'-O)/16S rRNA (cytidine1409-2'-O)-methyltransferase
VSKPIRLDAELVRRGLVRSRAEAKRAIEAGHVLVRGMPATKTTSMVTAADPIALATAAGRFVSRGGEKLDGALERLDVQVADKRWMDVGASTGGFTDRLLQGGASEVIAVDVGYGQLDWRLRNDPRVHVIERTNARSLEPGSLPFAPEGVTADLSFISLTVVLPALAAVAVEDADFVLMVKPQFEVGRQAVGRGGVVRDPSLWTEAVLKVVGAASDLGLGLRAAAPSTLPGPAGNREFFVHLRQGAAGDVRSEVERAIAEVP